MIEALVIKAVTMGGEGIKNYQILRDLIYGQPPNYVGLISLSFYRCRHLTALEKVNRCSVKKSLYFELEVSRQYRMLFVQLHLLLSLLQDGLL